MATRWIFTYQVLYSSIYIEQSQGTLMKCFDVTLQKRKKNMLSWFWSTSSSCIPDAPPYSSSTEKSATSVLARHQEHLALIQQYGSSKDQYLKITPPPRPYVKPTHSFISLLKKNTPQLHSFLANKICRE